MAKRITEAELLRIDDGAKDSARPPAYLNDSGNLAPDVQRLVAEVRRLRALLLRLWDGGFACVEPLASELEAEARAIREEPHRAPRLRAGR